MFADFDYVCTRFHGHTKKLKHNFIYYKMKKIIILTGVLAMVFATSCGTSKNLKSEQDSVAYAIGLDLGNYIKNMDSTLNVDVIAGAMKDVLAGKEVMQRDSAYAFLREYFTVRKPAKAKAASEEFLKEVEKTNKNIQKTESGILYEIITPGSDVKATNDADKVRVMYKGTLKDGKVFDSSYDRGDTAEFPLNRVIKGWSEGMKLVGKGGKIKLWIPSELGYGEQAPQSIGPNEALVFEVELIDVLPADSTAAPVQ